MALALALALLPCRYRNFRTLTSPNPVQFSSLAVDPSGEIVCAGTMDTFQVSHTLRWCLTHHASRSAPAALIMNPSHRPGQHPQP